MDVRAEGLSIECESLIMAVDPRAFSRPRNQKVIGASSLL